MRAEPKTSSQVLYFIQEIKKEINRFWIFAGIWGS